MARSNRAKRRLTLLGILLGSAVVAGAGSYAGVTWWRARGVAQARIAGYERFEAGEYEAALDLLSRYVAKNREDVDALLKLARCRAEVPSPNQRHLVDAAGFYREVIRLNPGNVEALKGLLDIYRRIGFAPELERIADELLRIEPNNVPAIESRTALAFQRGSWKEAMEGSERLMAIEPDAYKWRALHLEFLRKSDPEIETRLKAINRWIEAGEPDGRYRLFLADTLRQMNRNDEAREAAIAAVEKGMPDAQTLTVLLDLLDLLKLSDQSAKAVERALAAGLPRSAVVQMQVHRHYRGGRLDLARSELAAALSVLEASAPAKDREELLRWQVRIAEIDRDRVTSDAAIATLRQLIQSHGGGSAPESRSEAEVTVRWMDAIQASRGFDGGQTSAPPRIAMGQLQRALADNPRDSLLLLRAGDIALRAGEVDEAARFFASAFEAEGGRWPLAGIRQASALLAVGRTEEAFKLTRDLTRQFDDNIGVYFVFAQACDAIAREGRSPSMVDPTLPSEVTARVLLEKLYALDVKGNPIFLPPLLATLVAEGDTEEATRLANVAVSDPRTPVDTLLQIATLLAAPDFKDVPTRAIDAARGRDADPTELAMTKARVQIQRGEAGAARLAMRGALQSASGTLPPSVRSELARVQAEAGMREGGNDVPALLAEVLKEGENELDAIDFVLGQPAAWEDEGIVNAAAAKLGELIGETAPRTVLTNAARVLRFRRNDPQEIAKSIQAVDKVLEANGKSASALVTLSRLFGAAQPPDLARAASYLEQAVILQPGRRDLYPELIALMQASGDFPGANNYLQQFMRSAGSDDDQARLAANLMVRQGQFLSAIPTLERVARRPGSTEADLVALGDAERRLGRMDQAEKAFREALERPDRSALGAMAYAEFLARAGRLEEARSMVVEDAKREKPALTPANRAYLQARLELDYGDPALAAPAIAEAMRLAPQSPGVALLAARERAAAGAMGEAVAIARKGLETSPDNQQLLAFVSSLLMADPNSRESSAATLERLKSTNPALGELLTIVKACAGPDGTIRPGEEQLAALVELTNRYPSEPSVWTVAVDLHATVGRIEDAVRLARRGMARLPSEAGPAEMAARLLLQLRRTDEARDAARSWRALTADSPLEADLVLARVALVSGKPALAAETLQPYETRLRAEALKRPDALGIYAAAILLAGEGERAFATVRDGLEREAKENRPERLLLAEWLRGVRSAPTAVALDALARSETLLAVDDTGRGALATEYVAIAKRRNAELAAERAQKHLDALSPAARATPIATLLGAELAAIRGDVSAASATYGSVWESLPEDVRGRLITWSTLDPATQSSLAGARSLALFASNNQAAFLAKAGVELETATAAIDRALLISPDDPSLLETRGEVLLARKEFDQARILVEPLAARPDASPSLRVMLGRIHLAVGRVDDARRQADAAARMLEEDPFADRLIIEALEDLQAAIAAKAKPTA
jgi:tetratricopeptide (TPR) repeat protein